MYLLLYTVAVRALGLSFFLSSFCLDRWVFDEMGI